MYLKTKRIALICVFCSFCSYFFAQENDYRAEIGLLGGVAYYIGDANQTLFKDLTLDYGALFRYRFTTRFSARDRKSVV